MKKFFITSMLAIAGIATSFAHVQVTYFNMSEKDASTPILSVPFTEKPIVTYSFDKESSTSYVVVISDTQREGTKFELSKDYDITYSYGEPTAINEVAADSKSAMNYNGNTIIISRLDAGAKVQVFDSTGQQYASSTANSDGVATIDLTSVAKGIVVIQAGKSTFKIMK